MATASGSFSKCSENPARFTRRRVLTITENAKYLDPNCTWTDASGNSEYSVCPQMMSNITIAKKPKPQ